MDPAAIGRKIKELYPQYKNADDAVLGQKYMQKYGGAVSGIQSGQMTIKDIPEAQRAGVSVGLQGVGYQPPEKTNTAEQSLNATANFIEILEKRFMNAGGGEYTGTGARISGVKKGVAGALGINDEAKTYNDARKGFAATLKQLTGDTGVLTEQDYERLSNLLPKLGATPGEAQNKFSDLRTQIAAKFGGEATQTGYQAPESKGGALASVVPGVAELYKGKQQEIQQEGFGAVPKQSLQTLIPALNLAEKGGTKAAGEILTILGLGGLFKGAVGKAKGLTVKGASANRTKVAAEQSAKISGEEVYKKAEEKVLNSVSETDKKSALKMLDDAKEGLKGKTFDAQTVLDKLAEYNKAYTSTGRVGKSAKSAVNNALSKALREEMKTNMPNVYAAQEQLKTALGLGKNVRKTVGTIGLGATGVGALAYLASLLTGKKRSQ